MKTKINAWKKACKIFLIFVVGSIYFSEINAQALPASSYQKFSGSGKGKLTHGPVNYYGKTPVLSAFTLEYSSKNDRHYRIASIDTDVVQPAGDMIEVHFADKSPSTKVRYDYNVSLALINRHDVLDEGKIEGKCNRNWCQRRLPPPPRPDAVLVLKSFMLDFGWDYIDRHIHEIGIQVRGGQLRFTLNDKNKDDAFDFSASYVYLPRHMFLAVDFIERLKNVNGPVTRAIKKKGIPVIRGFRFKFMGKNWRGQDIDRHIGKISIDMRPNNLAAVLDFRDDTARRIDYVVEYGVLPMP